MDSHLLNLENREDGLLASWTLSNLFRTPSVAHALRTHEQGGLKRVLDWKDLIGYGLGSTVGAGIFVVYGVVAQSMAGPAVVLSFLLAAGVSLLSALCYAEFAARVPLSGSAYTFAYLSLGEIVAWFIGWNLTVEYTVAAAAVARGWASYVVLLLVSWGVPLPAWLRGDVVLGMVQPAPFAALIVFACTCVLLAGVKDSSRVTNAVTAINILMIVFIVIYGAFHIDTANYSNFAPFGIEGVFKGAGVVFFSYIGFDTVSTLAGEVKDPGRNLPIGIVGTLAIVTLLYCSVAIVMTGMVRYDLTDVGAPLASGFRQIGAPFAASVVGIGAVTTLTATTLCSLLGQPRIYFQMAQDGLLFSQFMRVSRTRGVPVFGTVVTGVSAGVLAALFPIEQLADVISIGTLLAFAVVCGGLLVLRYTPPRTDRLPRAVQLRRRVPLVVVALVGVAFAFCFCVGRGASVWISAALMWVFVCITGYLGIYYDQQPSTASFKCPWVPAVPAAGVLVNCFLLTQLGMAAFVRVLVWTFLGFLVYAFYGIRHSRLGRREANVNDSDDIGDDDGGDGGGPNDHEEELPVGTD